MPGYTQIKAELREIASPSKAVALSRFFKTGKGQYGEGDKFWGISVPDQRAIAKKHADATLSDIAKLLSEPVHECRFTALLILIMKYSNGSDAERSEIAGFYIENTRYINNWDLVDLSADKILGHYLADKDRGIIYSLAESSSLWEQRIAVLTTFYFIKNGDFTEAVAVCGKLMNHGHDLIHKATGWMLRETGKRDLKVLLDFLDRNYKSMPRTMLRYSIEKLDEETKAKYMAK